MLTFIVPLKPRRFANDWDRVVADLDATLQSILRQTDPDFRIVVAYEDLPQVRTRDPRIVFLHVPGPRSLERPGEADKLWRVTAAAAWLREEGGGAVMVVDADDWVSRRVAELVNAHPEVDAWVAGWGWERDARTARMRPQLRFWKLCGSCVVMRLRPEDLPEAPRMDFDGSLLGSRHDDWPGILRRMGRRVKRFPFAPAVYGIFNGENFSLMRAFQHGWKQALWRTLVPSLPTLRALREEFGIAAPAPARPAMALPEPVSVGSWGGASPQTA